jgi:proteasome-associated ATPase
MAIAEVTFEGGVGPETVYFRQFLSGADLRDIVDRAKQKAMKRAGSPAELFIRETDLREAAHAAMVVTKDVLNTSRYDDWAEISGAKGAPITFIRTVTPTGDPVREVMIGVRVMKYGSEV